MDVNQESMLKDIMATSFSAFDMHLYLNTHPYDQVALGYFNQAVQRLRILTDNYQRMYGPLTATVPSRCPWQWIESPWPWEGK